MLEPSRLMEHVHGHLGWLAALALAHPAILLRDPKRKAHLAVAFSVSLVTAAAALGVALYPVYRAKVKQSLFLHDPSIGLLFERKEHLAFGAIALAWAGTLAYFAARSMRDELAIPVRKFAFRAFAISAVLAIIAAAMGTIVATVRSI